MNLRGGVRVGFAAVILVLFLVSPHKVEGQIRHDRLKKLSEHTAGDMISLEQLPVSDCPQNVEELAPARLVVQVIAKTFYRWKEYDIRDEKGQFRFCVEVVEPPLGPLTQEEARILLSASQMWTEAPPKPENMMILDPSDPTLNAAPAPLPSLGHKKRPIFSDEVDVSARPEGFNLKARQITGFKKEGLSTPESIIGSDDRQRVSDTLSYPWNTICYLSYISNGAPWRCTAFLVSPYVALTAGHCVYDQDEQVWSSDFVIAPGQHQDYQGGQVYRPHGERYPVEWYTNTGYTGGGGQDYDYGAVMFETPFDDSISTFMPLEFDYTPNFINLAGYPGVVQNEVSSEDMWQSSGDCWVDSQTNRILEYDADTTPGNSGGPVWVYSSSTGLRRIVAVHNYGNIDTNLGARLVSNNEELITEWMQWTPQVLSDDGRIAAGDLNGDGLDDLIGVAAGGQIFYSLDMYNWKSVPGSLKSIVAGNLDGKGIDDLAGLTSDGHIFYSLSYGVWHNIPGKLSSLSCGDFNGDGKDDIVGLTSAGQIYCTLDLNNWQWIPGTLNRIASGELNGDGKDDLVGLTSSGQIFYTFDLWNWSYLPGTLSQITTGDLDGNGRDDLLGLTSAGQIFYSLDLSSWQWMPGTLAQITTGFFDRGPVADIAGLTGSGSVFVTFDHYNWTSIPGNF